MRCKLILHLEPTNLYAVSPTLKSTERYMEIIGLAIVQIVNILISSAEDLRN